MLKPGSIMVFALLAVLILAGLSGCAETVSETPSPAATSTASPDGWFWKAGGFIDYAKNGMPDFDQRLDGWKTVNGNWSYCGPVAVANSLWWFDSKFEPNPVEPPTINDNYPLVQSYGGPGTWDDHDARNVVPLVEDLAVRMDTDGQASGEQFYGTRPHDMENAIDEYLKDKDLENDFYEVTVKSPEFDWIVEEVERSEDVVLLLGFWEWRADESIWARIGGHYVTVAGVNSLTSQIGISDPYLDEGAPHLSASHDDASVVSHDIYKVVASTSPGGKWALEGYPATPELLANFQELNFAEEQGPFYLGAYVGGELHVEIDYAVAVSPGTGPKPTVTATPAVTPTPVPTSTPTPPPPVPTPSPTPAAPAATATPPATAEPTPTASPQATPTPPPPVPDPSAPVVTGISSTHKLPGNGTLVINVHALPTYFPQGTNIYDLHFFTEQGQHLGSVYLDSPLVPCTEYSFPVPYGGEVAPEFIIIYLTDADHNITGQTASQSF